MKLFGKYRYNENGKIKTRRYIISKRVPKHRRRIIIWGPTGYGKSSVLIEDVMRRNKNLLYISSLPFKSEWKHMRTDASISVYDNYMDVTLESSGKIAYDFGQISQTQQEQMFFGKILPYLQASGIVAQRDLTIIFDNLSFLPKKRGFLDEMTKEWKCKVIVDLTCGAMPYYEEAPCSYVSKKWKFMPVFTPLFTRYDDDLT